MAECIMRIIWNSSPRWWVKKKGRGNEGTEGLDKNVVVMVMSKSETRA